MPFDDSDVSEMTWLDPERVDAVKGPANGTPFLMLKSGSPCGDADCDVCDVEKAKLKAKQRNALPDSDFALPDERAYPIHDESHARNALSRVSQHGTPDEKKRVRAAVHRRYPDIGDGDAEKARTQEQVQSQEAEQVGPEACTEQTRQMHPDAGAKPSQWTGTTPPARGADVAPPKTTGFGDATPDKTLPTAEAESQTRAVEKETVDGGGDTAPDGAGEAERAEGAARSQTDATPQDRMGRQDTDQQRRQDAQAQKGKRKAKPLEVQNDASTPGSAAWEGQDAELARDALTHLDAARAAIGKLGSREAAEASKGITDEISRATELLSGLVDGTQTHQIASKEIDMTPEELIALLDQRDQARKEAKAAKQAKKEAKLAKAQAKATAKGGPTDAEEAATAAKSAGEPEDPQMVIKALQERVAHLEAQPARPRPAINGLADASVRPVQRGQEATGGDALAQLTKARDEATDPTVQRRLAGAVLVAKMSAAEQQRDAVHAARGLPVRLMAGQPGHAFAAAAAAAGTARR